MTASSEITIFTKFGGPLTKFIRLDENGSVVSDGSACTMARGSARRAKIASVSELAILISGLQSDQAIALGALRSGLPDQVGIVTKNQVNGQERPDVIARTGSDITYTKGQATFFLLDFDTKGMPREVADKIAAAGGYWQALVSVLPVLQRAGRVIRRSTSAGLKRSDTGAELKGSAGLHVYGAARDGTDVVRFLTTLHDRCWLNGLGWMMVGAAGQMLERSIVDRMVGASERLVFEGPPVLQPPLVQDAEKRRPVVTEGEVIDTLAVCAPLTLVEQQALRKLRAEAKQNLLPESNRVREAYIADQAQRLAARTGVTLNAAKRVIEQQCKGVLLADVVLPFDDPDMTTITVAHVLDDPAHFEGMTLADPIEGVEYGHCKAKIMRRSDGTPWINSFAHGHATYELKYDARAVSARVAQAENKVDAFVRSALLADLDEAETHQLVDQVHRLTGIGIRVITATLKAAKKEKNHQRMEEIRERKLAERTDPRTQVLNPPTEEPYAPVMKTLNEAAMLAPRSSRNKRDVDGERVRARLIKIPKMHQFKTSNAEEES